MSFNCFSTCISFLILAIWAKKNLPEARYEHLPTASINALIYQLSYNGKLYDP